MKIIRHVLTFFFVMFGWGLFSGFGTTLLGTMFGASGWGSVTARMACLAYLPLLLFCALISCAPKLPNVRAWRFAAPILMVLCLGALAAQGYAPFVYFQF